MHVKLHNYAYMNEESLRQKIETIYRSEQTAYRSNGRQTGGLGTFTVSMQVQVELLSDEPNQDVLHSRSAEAMLKLYSSLSPELRSKMLDILMSTLSAQSPFENQAYLTYFVLFRCGEIVEPIRKVTAELEGDGIDHYGYGNTMAMLANLITFEYDALSPSELSGLKTVIAESQHPYDYGCDDKIAEAEMRNLEIELGDVNPEINSDRDKVVTFWEETFRSRKIPDQIDLIEELFQEGSFDEQRLAACLDRVRVFLIDALKELSIPLATERGLPNLPTNPEDSAVMNWYTENNVLGTNQKKLIRAIHGLTSREGSHSASSRREYARIAKNVAIECVIMVIGLVQN